MEQRTIRLIESTLTAEDLSTLIEDRNSREIGQLCENTKPTKRARDTKHNPGFVVLVALSCCSGSDVDSCVTGTDQWSVLLSEPQEYHTERSRLFALVRIMVMYRWLVTENPAVVLQVFYRVLNTLVIKTFFKIFTRNHNHQTRKRNTSIYVKRKFDLPKCSPRHT